MIPIPGQPGLYCFGPGPGLGPRALARRGLAGLGVSSADLAAKLTAVQTQYNDTKSSMQPLLSRFGPLDGDSLKALLVAARQLGTAVAVVSAQQFVGVLRMGLAAATSNITRARYIINGGDLAGHESLVASLLTAAQNTLDALGTLISGAVVAQGAAAAGARRLGLGVFGLDDATVMIIAVAGMLIGAAVLVYVISMVWQSQQADAAADSACARDAAAGHPCTGAQREGYREAAAAAASADSPLPNLDDLFRQATTGLLWIGGLAVAAAVGYGIWTSLPAASAARERLRARAERL